MEGMREVLSSLTMEKVGAAKQLIENQYYAQVKNIQSGKRAKKQTNFSF